MRPTVDRCPAGVAHQRMAASASKVAAVPNPLTGICTRARHPAQRALPSVPPQLLGIPAAVEIKSVIDGPLAADGLVIVVALGSGEPPETFGNRLKTRET